MLIGKIEVKAGDSPLKAIREALGHSQESLARLLGVSNKKIYRWEHGETPVEFTVPQVKILSVELARIGLRIEDLPDDLGSCN